MKKGGGGGGGGKGEKGKTGVRIHKLVGMSTNRLKYIPGNKQHSSILTHTYITLGWFKYRPS